MAILLEPDTPETRRALNELARLQIITRLENDILMDLQICEIEGWDKKEFINKLRALLNGLGERETK